MAAAPAAKTVKPVQPSPQALALARAVRDNRAEAKGVQAQITHLRQQLTALAAVEAAGERGTGDKRTRLQDLTREEDALAVRLGKSQGATARLLGVLALYRRDPPPALLVNPTSARDAVRAQILARALAPELEAKSRALSQQLDDLRRLRRQVDTVSEDLFKSESAVAEQRAELEQLIADRITLQRSLVADADTADAQLRDLAREPRRPRPGPHRGGRRICRSLKGLRRHIDLEDGRRLPSRSYRPRSCGGGRWNDRVCRRAGRADG